MSLRKLLEKASFLYSRAMGLGLGRFFPGYFCLAALVLTLSSCAGVTKISPQVNDLAVDGQYAQALQILENPKKYGANNKLLFLFDKGLVLHLAGRYEESILVFEEAKLIYEELYTQSLTKNAGSWLWNDYALPYRGEDFERVMVNVFQALNFAALGKIDEALVEARDVDSVLKLINDQYSADQKNVYRQDAFARFLMGILYESTGKLNDAVISYKLSFQAYERDYLKHYATATPQILKENLLAAAEKFGARDLDEYRNAFSGVDYIPWNEKQKKGEIVVIEYQGLSPVKVPVEIPIPLPDGYISKIAFPRYEKRHNDFLAMPISASTLSGGVAYSNRSQLGEDIAAIAVKNLDDRKVRVIAKSVVRLTGKYAAEKALEKHVDKQHGQGMADAVKIVGSLYNFFSEQADLRCWQTLPAQIAIGRLILNPGDYALTAADQDLGKVHLAAGEKKFFIVRTFR